MKNETLSCTVCDTPNTAAPDYLCEPCARIANATTAPELLPELVEVCREYTELYYHRLPHQVPAYHRRIVTALDRMRAAIRKVDSFNALQPTAERSHD